MKQYAIDHKDADHVMVIDAETSSKAKFKNFRDWADAFSDRSFKNYLIGLVYCRRIKNQKEDGEQ